ncbi:dihydroorotate dehydrogenase electron transfer subunit [Parabacteroides sp. An277]|uniref:dihydroorotate dehydrogenase electron transfer subunit n=1 Tax=Parabacteroides sp. An277 TaxID=1965619 RepID=UPI000B37FF36|nr:dihydroorotate dehydrogenase electron transfer subunit [Parabacteroides sp. An277]OUO53206.1 dihydroorotate dehydrogenase electron transfer subunit [Parabacteroides sp. An277]
MKKYMLDLKVVANERLHPNYCLLKLAGEEPLPEMRPGQFVQVRVEGSSATFLRRPISIHYVDKGRNELWLLIQLVGDGTRRLAEARVGDLLNLLLPLGNGFTLPEEGDMRELLLIGGGVGTAPLLYLGACLKAKGFRPTFLLGARSEGDLLQLAFFRQYGEVYLTTEDGSVGERGYVTNHSLLSEKHFDQIYTCGPKPMMVSVARYASAHGIACEASLENTMACGIGACLCCVEKLKDEHHVCVCTEGPVFNIEKLSWLN